MSGTFSKMASSLTTGAAKRTFSPIDFQSTRLADTGGIVFVLHDTTEFSYRREKSEAIGITKSINSGRARRLRSHVVCGILMHSSLAITIEGRAGWRPLGPGPEKIQRDGGV
ncbi:hypothetical protein ACVI1L_004918 [Bradyrhizobium sp. USDA 4516]